MRRTLQAVACCWALTLAGAASAQVAVPPLRAPVTDLTGTLTSQQVAALDQTLRAFEARKGSQLAVLIVPTTKPEAIEQYSIRVAEAWKLGRKDVDDGAILLIAKDDRELRIEVGYGLEGALPDVIASRIIREVITPRFREGDFYQGIAAGVDRIIRTVDGEPLPASQHRARGGDSGLGGALPILLIGAFVIGGVLRAIFGRLGGAAIAGGFAAFIAWLLVSTLAISVIAGLIAFFVTLLGGGRGWSNRGGWGGGLGGGWGGGMGGGGWSGGGGGFGGGGASGRW